MRFQPDIPLDAPGLQLIEAVALLKRRDLMTFLLSNDVENTDCFFNRRDRRQGNIMCRLLPAGSIKYLCVEPQ